VVTLYLRPVLRIGLIGLGSRGLSILERLLSIAEQDTSRSIEIIAFEPNPPGCGVHATDQPDYMLLNTIAAQLGIYPDAAALSECPDSRARPGPNFFDWCVAQGIRVDEAGHVVDAGGRPVRETDFLPRRLLGDYLSDAWRDIVEQAPDHVTVTVHRERARCVRLGPWRSQGEARGYRIEGEAGAQAIVDRLILTTGHAAEAIEADSRPHPSAGEPLLMEGLGLTAMDQLAALSQGLGGRFVRDETGICTYLPSGHEPRILLQSREGLPFWSRPDGLLARARHVPLALTPARLAQLRASSPDGQLDFDADIVPLMRLEMRGAALAVAMAGGDATRLSMHLADMAATGAQPEGGLAALAASIDDGEARHGALDCERILSQAVPGELDDAGYHDWFAARLAEDLKESRAGLLLSRTKAAAEVWRDLREMLRKAVDHHGLTLSSHRRFYGHWTRIINRLVAGPQKERSEDLLALMQAGVVTLLHPRSKAAENLPRMQARVRSAGLCGASSGVYADLRALGHIRATVAEPGYDGVETAPDNRAVGRQGEPTPDLWVIGPATEGSTYYNHYVPAPGAPNRAMADAHRVAEGCLRSQDAQTRRKSA
jgi:uncharacterized NAD(P)/FAD-binding protein YdhS